MASPQRPEQEPGELEWVATGELIDELSRRFRSCLIVTDSWPTDEETEQLVSYDGGVAAAAGLAAFALAFLQQRMLGQKLDEDEDDG